MKTLHAKRYYPRFDSYLIEKVLIIFGIVFFLCFLLLITFLEVEIWQVFFGDSVFLHGIYLLHCSFSNYGKDILFRMMGLSFNIGLGKTNYYIQI